MWIGPQATTRMTIKMYSIYLGGAIGWNTDQIPHWFNNLVRNKPHSGLRLEGLKGSKFFAIGVKGTDTDPERLAADEKLFRVVKTFPSTVNSNYPGSPLEHILIPMIVEYVGPNFNVQYTEVKE